MKRASHITPCPAAWGLLSILLFAGCEKFEFQNPVDSSVLLETPTTLSARFVVDSTIELRWSDPNTYTADTRAALTYLVEHGTDGTTFPDHYTLSGDSTIARVNDSFLKMKKHYFRLRTSVSKHTTEYSNTAAAEFMFPAPYALTVVSLSEQDVRLQWSDTNQFETRFIIEMTDGTHTFVPVGTTERDSVGCTLRQPFHSDSIYIFRVAAQSSANISEYSNAAQASFTFAAPSQLSAAIQSESKAVLQWKKNSSLGNAFEIEMAENGGAYNRIASVGIDTISLALGGIFHSSSRYAFRVRAVSTVNASSYSNTADALLDFPAPSGLTTLDISEQSVRLQWKANDSFAAHYEVEMSENGGAYARVALTPQDSNAATIIKAFLSRSLYAFRVRAVTAVNASGYSNTATAQLEFPAPSQATLVSLAENAVRISWQRNDAYATGYEVEMNENGGAFARIALASKDSGAITATGIFLRSSIYMFRVRAVTSVNASNYSNTATGQLSFPAPSQLALVSLTENGIRVSWKRNDTYATGYEVELGENGGAFLRMNTAQKDSSSITITHTFLTSAAYAVRVRAVSAFNQSDYSNIITPALHFPAPSSLTVGGISEASLELRWTSTAGFEEQYVIERKPVGGVYAEVGHVSSPLLLFADQTVQKAQRYVYRVKALSAYNASSYSSEVTAGYGIQDAVYVRSMNGHITGVLGLAFLPTGGRMISAGSDARMVVWDMVSGEIVRNITGHTRPVNGVAVSPDGQTVASASGDKTVRLWNSSTGAPIDTFKSHVGDVLCVAYSPNGQIIASGGADTKLHVWIPSANDSEVTLAGHADNINAVAFSPDGLMMASASSDRTIRLWSTSTWMLLRILTGHTDAVKAVAFSSDNQSVISGSYDKKVRVWRVSDGAVVHDFIDDASEINAVAVSADGRMLASGAVNTTARVRMIHDGATTKAMARHSQMVNAVAFSPDASLLATGSNDTSINIWQIISQWMIMP